MHLDVIAAFSGHVRPPADKTKDSASCLGAKSVVFHQVGLYVIWS